VVEEKQTQKSKNNQLNMDISLLINGVKSTVTSRIKNIFEKFFSLEIPICQALSKSKLNIKIESKNTFPMASGCASSASSMAALVGAVSSALQLSEKDLPKIELTKLARVGSGSACRSIFGGVCEWIKDGGKDSHAVQIYDEKYWDLGVKLIIVNQKVKDISSSLGMKITKETSELFQYRINHVVEKNLKNLKNCLKDKNFHGLAEIIIRDSNNFHACCRDSYPTINYFNEESEYIMKGVSLLNSIYEKNICAYTFDAGSNAFIIFERTNEKLINDYFDFILGFSEKIFCDKLKDNKDIMSLVEKKPPKEKILKQVNFKLGEGIKIINE